MKYILLILTAFGLISCDPDRIYEENLDLPDAEWRVPHIASFEFEIPDRNRKYDLYVNIRNSVSYEYHNIYFKYRLLRTGGDLVQEDLVSRNLFDPKTGQPLGSGIGDIFDHRLPLLNDFSFEEPGIYQLELTQYMRRDTLRSILSVGVRVESSGHELEN